MYLYLFTIIAFFLCVDNAFAYVGPGLGLGAIGVFLGVIFALLLGLIGIIWYPFRRMIKKYRAHQNSHKEMEK